MLDVGSDHRCIQADFEILYYRKPHGRKLQSNKGWMPELNEYRQPNRYQAKLDELLHADSRDDPRGTPRGDPRGDPCGKAKDIVNICLSAAKTTGSIDAGPKFMKRPERSNEFKELVLQRRIERDANRRRNLSKHIYKRNRQEIRL